jgi:anti-anti-sigma factor
MSFSLQRRGTTASILVEGQLILTDRQALKQAVLEELERGARTFVLDFAQTGYVDSAGLGVLASLTRTVRERGGAFRLTRLNSDLRTLFTLTKLDTLFQIEDTEDESSATRPAPPPSPSPDPLHGAAEGEPPDAERAP